MVLESEFPPDERVEKEIESLQEIGFHVSIAVYTFTNKPEFELFNGYEIHRKKISELLYKSSAVILILPLYFKFWYKFLHSLLEREKYDFLHIHDLPLSKIGYRLSRKFKMKLVCDQHEYYSNWIVRTKHYNTIPGRLIRLLSNWVRYEKKYLRRADLVITVEDSLKKIYVEQVGISTAKIISLPNTPRSSVFHLQNVDPEIVERYQDRFVLFYGGSLDHIRGIDFVAGCIAELKDEITNILFLVAGKENRAFSLDRITRDLHIEGFVDYVGWIPLRSLPSYIAASHICIFVPKADNLEINNTIATKIYQYATMGKPVIVSETKMMKEFVESNRIGFSVNYGDIQGFCEVVRKIYGHSEIAAEIRSKAIQLASEYTWEKTSKALTSAYLQMNSSA